MRDRSVDGDGLSNGTNGCGQTKRKKETEPSVGKEGVLLRTFHTFAFAIHVYVFLWHFGDEAAKLPGARGFGFFFRYLTFVSFTFQLVQLTIVVLWSLGGMGKGRLGRLSDDLSCASFPLACTVTIMFQIVKKTTKEAVEGGHIARPFWLDFTVHYWNSMIALVDLLASRNRTFSRKAQNIALSMAFFYIVWIHVVKVFNKIYPYPFLNKLPQPYGIIITSASGTLICFLLFKFGELLHFRKAKVA